MGPENSVPAPENRFSEAEIAEVQLPPITAEEVCSGGCCVMLAVMTGGEESALSANRKLGRCDLSRCG